MQIHDITTKAGKHKTRRRVGRGLGSGHGKTCGRGHKGDGSRSGNHRVSLSEGGQMPLFRRLPKRGFNNAEFETCFEVVNVAQLERFDDGASVGLQELRLAGLIRSTATRVKVLGEGQLTKKLQVGAQGFSKTAEQKITGCGGAAKVVK